MYFGAAYKAIMHWHKVGLYKLNAVDPELESAMGSTLEA
jgi:hypothetical protein